jgi:hypothetical protein
MVSFGASWKEGIVGSARVASALDQAAVVYAEAPAVLGPWTIRLERLGLDGSRTGQVIELGKSGGMGKGGPPDLTTATDGSTFVACWDDEINGEISCSAVAKGANDARAVAVARGTDPRLAYGPSGFVVLYPNFDGGTSARKISGDGPQGAEVIVTRPASSSPRTLIATRSGYAAATSETSVDQGEVWTVYRLGAELTPDGAPVVVPGATAFLTMAASPTASPEASLDQIVVLYRTRDDVDQYSLSARAIDASGALSSPTRIVTLAQARPRPQLAAVGAAGSFALSWGTSTGGVEYLGVQDSGTPIGAATMIAGVSAGGGPTLTSIASVPDGFLVALSPGVGDKALDPIDVLHLGCGVD